MKIDYFHFAAPGKRLCSCEWSAWCVVGAGVGVVVAVHVCCLLVAVAVGAVLLFFSASRPSHNNHPSRDAKAAANHLARDTCANVCGCVDSAMVIS